LLFPPDPILAYAGILPPLRTPHHPLERRSLQLKLGEFREGVVIGKRSGGVDIDIGVERSAFLQQRLSRGSRVTVEVMRVSHEDIRVRRVESSEIGIYWGFRVSNANPTLGEAIGKKVFDLVVTTSRLGKPLTEGFEEIRERWRSSQNALIAFGSPREGLDKIMGKEGLDRDGT
jgi:predicted SPOUT superfamily RNA methylase MTH1